MKSNGGDCRETLCEIPEKFVQVTVRGNSLCHFQQGMVPLGESVTGRCGLAIHGEFSMRY